jgi:IS4 transposase
MELYQIRWSIEVMFKECKQYLRLGKSQNTDFYGQIADASLVMITYIILTLYKRFEVYETLGSLFRDTQAEMFDYILFVILRCREENQTGKTDSFRMSVF